VYSGGDDVLALVPADLCVPCARQLHDAFAKHLEQWASHTPSLSVGIAIGHFMEPLEDLLAYARAAEKAAKAVKGKNALAVHLHSRGGAPVKFSAGWPSNPDKDLDTLVRMYVDGRLPDKAAYDLRLLGKLYEKWPAEANAAVAADATRLLKRKRVTTPDPEWTAMRESLTDEESLNRAAQMMLVARKLARSVKQARPAAGVAGA
jgi:CRISPR-associated protein Cmr2